MNQEMNTAIIEQIKTAFQTQFPLGYINIYDRGRCDAGQTDIVVYIGLIGEKADVAFGIRENDPMWHIFAITANDATAVEAKQLTGGLSCKPTNPMYAMETRKTGFRKTTGNATKITQTFDKWFKKLKAQVVAESQNIYSADKYAKYIF